MLYRLLFVLACLLFAIPSHAGEDDEERKFSVQVGLSPVIPVVTHNQASVLGDKAPTTSGPNFYFNAEYYISMTPFSVTAGFSQESVEFYQGDVTSGLAQLSVGGRWYMLPPTFSIQPYVGVGTYWNVSARKDVGTIVASGSRNYSRDYYVRSPLLSVAPVVGVDIYVFSSVALELGYSFRMGIDGRASSSTTYQGDKSQYAMRAPLNRHTFSVGVKLSLPFRFTNSDMNSVINSLFDYR